MIIIKNFDIKALGNEIKEIYNNKIKNNKDFNKIVEKFPYLNQSLIEYYINQYIDALVKGLYN